ncbi:T9SS type A sorting domain-containing protein [Longibacter sp.]|uniref:T9SS type A sorting domain-containing protein n=1 Tax=Longibacter sp. TaxID=2045415 RepID=UPI003EB83F9A
MSLTSTNLGSQFTLQPGGRLIPFVVVLVAFMAAWSTMSTPAIAQQTFQVDSRGDAGDANVGDGSCETAGGVCTLRAAIEEANADGADDTIEFGNIPTTGGFAVISPSSEFRVTETVTIDGTTAPNWSSPGPPVVVLDGNGISGNVEDGLDIRTEGASGTSVSALAVNNFPDDGINVLIDAADVTVTYCYVGIDVDGTTAAGNGDNGVEITADNAFIGAQVVFSSFGFTAAGRNVISGNGGDGIYVSASDAIISENYIGTTANGDAALGNGQNGVEVNSGTGNAVGYVSSSSLSTFYLGSVISGNSGNGVFLSGGTTEVLSNNIGTSADGMSDLPNSTGIVIQSNGNTIGPASDTPARNVVSGNTFNGIRLGNGGSGTSSDNNTIQFNYIGVTGDASGTLGNGQGIAEAGIRIDLGSDNLMTENVIGGNTRGVYIRNDNSLRNFIRSNYIGTNRSFADLGNSNDGVFVNVDPTVSGNPSDENEVGGESAGDGNVIGFNGDDGVQIAGNYNDIFRNHIGTNLNGDNLGNDDDGVFIGGANDVNIGLSADDGNVIGNNGGDGIEIDDADNVFVEGNYVGTNANGDDLGNTQAGIYIDAGSQANGNEVGYDEGNTIPDDPSPGNGDGNAIAFNSGPGVAISGSGTLVENVVRGNLVYSNGQLGIDLADDGQTSNDFGDTDNGVNNLQNAPELDQSQTQFNQSTGEVEVRYLVNCNTTECNYGGSGLTVDFYLADGESSGEGKTFLYTDQYPSSAATSFRNISFAPPSGVTVTRDDFIVGTATDADGNTSEFTITSRQLPVELAGFKAQPSSENVVLTWRTLSEKNNDRFIVQHQDPESETFARLGEVEGQGSTSETTRYRFATETLEAGSHTFRLKQVDVDGSSSLSKEVTAQIQMQADLTLEAPAPNPVRDQISVSFGVREAQPVQLSVYDMLGRKVATLYNGTPTAGQTQTVERSVRGLASGRYFVRLEGGAKPVVQSFTVVR